MGNVVAAVLKSIIKTGTNTLDAILTAYGDPACDAVVLVTDGLPDQRPEEILDHVSYASHGRPVHAIYLAHSETDTVSHKRKTKFTMTRRPYSIIN